MGHSRRKPVPTRDCVAWVIGAMLLAAACAGSTVGPESKENGETAPTQTTAGGVLQRSPGVLIAPMLTVSDVSQIPAIVGTGDGFVKFQSSVSGAILMETSTDGIVWQPASTDLGLTTVSHLVAVGDSVLAVGFGAEPTNPGQVTTWISSDAARHWTLVPLPTRGTTPKHVRWDAYIEHVAFDGSAAVMLGRESQRVDWRSYAVDVYGVDHGDVRSEGGSSGEWTVSFADGVDLTVDLADLGVDTNAVDRGGVTAWSLLQGVWYAQAQSDGFLEGRGGVADVANGPNSFVAIGAAPAGASQIISYGVFHSHDGVSWEPSPLPDQLDSTGATIVGGPLGYIANGAGVLYHSLDGVSWTDVHHFEGSAPPGTGLPVGTRPAAGRAGYAIPVPGGSPAEPGQLVRVLTSRDGKTWTETSVPAGAIGAAVAVSDTSILVQPYEFGQAALGPNTGENPSVTASSAASPAEGSPSAQGPPSSAASSRIEDLLACLAGQGLRPSDVQPYAPEIALAAWKPCSQLNREIASNSGLPADKLDEMAAFVDCMTQHGWIPALLTSDPADVKALNSASLGCRPRGPAVAVAECLRLHGLDVPDPSGGGTTLVQPYPVEKAVPAWRACRDVYVAAARIPADMVPRGIERLDCMAQHGWLTVVFTELPDDAAYDVASETCPQGFGP